MKKLACSLSLSLSLFVLVLVTGCPDHETFIDVYDPETDETERINYVDLNYFFDLDQSIDFDSEYYRTTEPLLSFMEHQHQDKLDELDTELTNIDVTLFSSYSFVTNMQYIADNPIFDTF